MKKFAAAVLLLTAACATSRQDDDANVPSYVPPAQTALAPAATDERVAEMQTQMTELLERIDVLNDRIAKLESGAPVGAAGLAPPTSPQEPGGPRPPAPTTAQAAPDTPTQPSRAIVSANIAENYRSAIVLYGKSRVSEARRAFQSVFDADPTGDLADNALFWIGESYFAAGDYSNAVRYYQRVVNEFAEQNKAPDAMYKIALSQEKTGDLALARRTLQDVIARYPYSSPAASAKRELERIKF